MKFLKFSIFAMVNLQDILITVGKIKDVTLLVMC